MADEKQSIDEQKVFLPREQHLDLATRINMTDQLVSQSKQQHWCLRSKRHTARYISQLGFCSLIVVFCFSQMVLHPQAEQVQIYILLLGLMVGYQLGNFSSS